MNIIKRELHSNLKGLLIWSSGVLFFILAGMQKFDALMANGSTQMNELLETLPDIMKTIFGLSLIDMSSPLGYFAILALYLVVLTSIYSAMLGVNILYKEERDCTAEFLMTKPISREKILLNKFLAAIINVTIINFILLVFSLLIMNGYDNTIGLEILKISFGIYLTSLIFMSFGIFVAAAPKFPGRASISVLAFVMSSFIMHILVDGFESVRLLRYLTPFKYFDAKEIITNGFYFSSFILTIVMIVSFISYAYFNYNKRDLDI